MSPVRLRPWRARDAAAIEPMTRDPHIRRWSSMGTDVESWIERQQAGMRGPSLAICTEQDDRPLGKIAVRMPGHASPATTCEAVTPADQPVGELSYWLLPEARGRGLATAAVQAMMRLIASQTTLRSVVLDIEDTNEASIRMAGRVGAERRRPERQATDRTGALHTMVVFVLRVPARSAEA